jgi:RNase P subunit RPR2
MSKAAARIGCPNCEAPAVEISEATERTTEFGDGQRLKGTSVDCRHCGDEFELYFY